MTSLNAHTLLVAVILVTELTVTSSQAIALADATHIPYQLWFAHSLVAELAYLAPLSSCLLPAHFSSPVDLPDAKPP